MEFQPSLKKSQTSVVVKVFAIISLALTMIGAFTRFIDIKYVENGYFDEWGDYVYEDLARLEFSFPNLYEFLSLSLVLSPVILFFVFPASG